MLSLLKKSGAAGLAVLALSASSFAADVTFSVDMSVQQSLGNFDPANDLVVVRGDMNSWSGNTEQLMDPDSDMIYEGTFTIDETTLPMPEYKFVNVVGGATDSWETVNNRVVDISGGGQITIPTVFFDDNAGGGVDADITFQCDMSVQTSVGNFNPANGDKIVVRGSFNGWGGAADELFEDVLTGIHTATATINATAGTVVEYKFVHLVPDGAGGFVDGWESVPNRTFTFDGNNQTLPVVYFDDVSPNDIITQAVTVTFQVDVTNAMDYNGGTPIPFQSIDNVYIAGFFNNWPWDNFTDPDWEMHDDGVAPDMVAGDMIYTTNITFDLGAAKSQQYKFSVNGPDNESGIGENHVINIDDTNPTMVNVVDAFGVIVDVEENSNPGVIETSILASNYPNPFNPTTSIEFKADQVAPAQISIFNVLGQEINSFDLGVTNSGNVVWNGTDFNNAPVSSGIYFYQVNVGKAQKIGKMTLLK